MGALGNVYDLVSVRSPLTQDISAPIGGSADAVEKRMNMHFGGKKKKPFIGFC